MKLKILAIITLATPLWLSTPLRAHSLVEFSEPVLVTQEASWNEFSSQQGRFAVLMPGTPEKETKTDQDGSTLNSFSLIYENSAFLIYYSDISNSEDISKEEITKFLDNAPSEFAKDVKAKLISTNNVTLDGYPGKEFEFIINVKISEEPGSTSSINGKGRVYVVKNRLYIIVGMTTKPDNIQRFLDSFRLL